MSDAVSDDVLLASWLKSMRKKIVSGCAKLPSPNIPSPNSCSKADLAVELFSGEKENLKSIFLPGKCTLHLRFSLEQLKVR